MFRLSMNKPRYFLGIPMRHEPENLEWKYRVFRSELLQNFFDSRGTLIYRNVLASSIIWSWTFFNASRLELKPAIMASCGTYENWRASGVFWTFTSRVSPDPNLLFRTWTVWEKSSLLSFLTSTCTLNRSSALRESSFPSGSMILRSASPEWVETALSEWALRNDF